MRRTWGAWRIGGDGAAGWRTASCAAPGCGCTTAAPQGCGFGCRAAGGFGSPTPPCTAGFVATYHAVITNRRASLHRGKSTRPLPQGFSAPHVLLHTPAPLIIGARHRIRRLGRMKRTAQLSWT